MHQQVSARCYIHGELFAINSHCLLQQVPARRPIPGGLFAINSHCLLQQVPARRPIPGGLFAINSHCLLQHVPARRAIPAAVKAFPLLGNTQKIQSSGYFFYAAGRLTLSPGMHAPKSQITCICLHHHFSKNGLPKTFKSRPPRYV